MALFCAVFRCDSVSLLRFSFLSHVQIFSQEISKFFFFIFVVLCTFFSLGLVVLLIPSFVVSRFSLRARRIFLCQIPSLFWLYIFNVFIRVSISFSFFTKSLMSSMFMRWLILSCDLLSFYPHVYFLSIWLSGFIAITITNCDSASPWKTPLWIFTIAKL